MWIIATEDLEYYIPTDGYGGKGFTQQDVSTSGIPRIFKDRNSAAISLGMWLVGPFTAYYNTGDECWETHQVTDPGRKPAWEGKLAPRKIKVIKDV